MTWQLGILTDQAGYVHLGAVMAGKEPGPAQYFDLLSPVGACHVERDRGLATVLVHGEQLSDLHRLVERCIQDMRLRDQLLKLIELTQSADLQHPLRAA
jgi:hypothetical protein